MDCPKRSRNGFQTDGLTHLKIKLNGDDLDWDVAAGRRRRTGQPAGPGPRGCKQWHYSLDFNEKCRDVEYVLEFLRQLESQSPAGFRRVQYIEQPTHRDLAAHRENHMQAAAAIKPVVIDESLVDLESLLLSRQLGYSGVALKACKGHAEALLMGAAAQKYGMFLCVQDLTCPGASFLHSASLAARIPDGGGDRRQRTPVLPGRQPSLAGRLSLHVSNHRWHRRDRRALPERLGISLAPCARPISALPRNVGGGSGRGATC